MTLKLDKIGRAVGTVAEVMGFRNAGLLRRIEVPYNLGAGLRKSDHKESTRRAKFEGLLCAFSNLQSVKLLDFGLVDDHNAKEQQWRLTDLQRLQFMQRRAPHLPIVYKGSDSVRFSVETCGPEHDVSYNCLLH